MDKAISRFFTENSYGESFTVIKFKKKLISRFDLERDRRRVSGVEVGTTGDRESLLRGIRIRKEN